MGDRIRYGQLGRNFVYSVVTPERVAATIAHVAGQAVDVGPMRAGPGDAATVTATGTIGGIEARVTSRYEPLELEASIPIELSLHVRVAGTQHRYRGRVVVPLRLRVVATEPVVLTIDIAEVLPREIDVTLEAGGLPGRLLRRVGNIDTEVRRTVATVVNDRLSSPDGMAARRIDVLEEVDEIFSRRLT